MLSACSRGGNADANLGINAEVLAAGLNTYLAQRGDLCLAKNVWPIDVTQHEVDVGARNALQMPVLERLGLVSSTIAQVEVDDEGTTHRMKVRRYALTEEGRKHYHVRTGTDSKAALGDFCAASLSLDKVVGWELVKGAEPSAVVTYTYRIDAAPWTRDAEAQKVFPMVANVVRGAGTAKLQETFRRTDHGWVAVDLLGS